MKITREWTADKDEVTVTIVVKGSELRNTILVQGAIHSLEQLAFPE